PETMLKSVVLPAPFGPMMARRSPESTERVTSLRTSRPAKFLQTRSRLSSPTHPPRLHPRPDTHDAAAHEQHEHHEQRAHDELPATGEHRRKDVLNNQVGGGAQHGTDERGFAAQKHHQDGGSRDGKADIRRRDELIEVR